jgi:glycosyltransferase involved in cell wall biosynthesis
MVCESTAVAVTACVRVLHVIQNLHYGGMEKLLSDIVRHVDKTRFETHVLALQYLGRYAREMEGHAALHLGPAMSRLSLLWPASLAACIAKLQPDVVHTHSGVWYKAARAARLAGVQRIAHTEHGQQPEGSLARFLDRRAARLTNAVIAVSRPLRTYMAGRLRLPESRIGVIRNGVDTDTFRPRTPSGALWSELALRPDQPIVGSIGRLEPVKGYEVVIEAFGELCRRGRSDRPVLVIAGEGSSRADLEALIGRLGLRDRVFLLGWRDDTLDLYSHFRCFVLGSWSEGTSVSLAEAMSCGVPPAVTAVGGNPDLLGRELAQQMVPPGDVRALATCLENVLDGDAARIGGAARQRIENDFGLARMVRQYEAIYLGNPSD